MCWRQLGNREDAEQGVAETMLRAVRAANTFRWKNAGFDAWIFRICRNVLIDMLRAREPPGGSTPDEGPPSIDTVAEGVVLAEKQAAVRRALDRLPADDRELLELRVIAGLSSDEVAYVLGKRPGAIQGGPVPGPGSDAHLPGRGRAMTPEPGMSPEDQAMFERISAAMGSWDPPGGRRSASAGASGGPAPGGEPTQLVVGTPARPARIHPPGDGRGGGGCSQPPRPRCWAAAWNSSPARRSTPGTDAAHPVSTTTPTIVASPGATSSSSVNVPSTALPSSNSTLPPTTTASTSSALVTASSSTTPATELTLPPSSPPPALPPPPTTPQVVPPGRFHHHYAGFPSATSRSPSRPRPRRQRRPACP